MMKKENQAADFGKIVGYCKSLLEMRVLVSEQIQTWEEKGVPQVEDVVCYVVVCVGYDANRMYDVVVGFVVGGASCCDYMWQNCGTKPYVQNAVVRKSGMLRKRRQVCC